MSSILIAAPAHFLAGLALFTLAAMTCAAQGRAAARQSATCGLSALIALGLAEWCDLAVGGSTRPMVWQLARLALEMVGLVALIELGQRRAAGPRTGFLPRWSYPLVAALALAAVLLARLNPLEFALRLATLWQAGWLAAGYFSRGQISAGRAGEATIPAIGPRTIAVRAIIGGLLVYLAAGCVAMPLLAMAAALLTVAAAWLAFGPSPDKSRRAKLLWRCVWPVGFLLIAAGGCFALPAASTNEDGLLLVELAEPADGETGDLASADLSSPEASDDTHADRDESAASETAAETRELVHQARRIGLGVSPIILFVLLVWGLSRLPFVH